MGKSARKNKEKKKDFQKVKLKVGKKLAKADNFTDTTFKSRAIQIREQLKTSDQDGGPVTGKKQNIQELLCQVNHYNSSIRSHALQNIQTLLATNPTLIPVHLPTLIPTLSTIMSDKEGSVRQAGAALLRIIMNTLEPHQMAPFFSTVCMHLCCAMTHIQEDVQLDSLVVMETILQHYPSLLAPHCKELLRNFIQLISQQRNKLGSSSSLKVNPSGKLAGQKWRLKVLQMLQKFLDVIRKSKEREALPQKGVEKQAINVNATPGKPTYAPILRADGAFNGRSKPFVLRADQSLSTVGFDFLSNPDAILEVAHALVPLLLQCWGEVNLPSMGKGQGGVILGQREQETLVCVLGIMQTLWRILEKAAEEKGNESALEQMRKAYQRKITQHFQQGFPYSLLHHAPSQTKRGNTKPPSGSSLSHSATPINLAACYLVLSILVVDGKKPRPWMRMVREFVEDVLREEEESQLGQEDQGVLMDVVMKMMSKEMDDKTSVSLEQSLFVYYEKAHPLSQQKLRALKTLRSICLDSIRPDEGNISEKLPAFLASLGELVITAKSSPLGISQEALHTLLIAASRGYKQAVQCMEVHIPKWLAPQNAIMDTLDEQTQRRLLECLYYLPSLDSVILNHLTRYCCQPSSNVHFPIYLIANRCFDNVFITSRKTPLTHHDFIDFVFNVSLGTPQEDLASLQKEMETGSHPSHPLRESSINPFYYITHGNRDVGLIHRADAVNKVAIQVYLKHPNQEIVTKAIQDHLQDMLESYRHLPISTCLSIMAHTSMLSRSHLTAFKESSFISFSSSSSFSFGLYSTSASRTLDSIDGMIGSLLFVLFYDTAVRDVANLMKGEEEYVTDLWKWASDCAATFRDGTIGSLIDCALCACKDHLDDRQISDIIIRLLQTKAMKRKMHVHRIKLLSLLECIQNNLALPSESRWFAELKYEVNLLASEVQPDR